MTEVSEGFLLQASLILALGAQNLFVLESGLRKRRHLLVAAICSLCDALLIAVGVAGAASVFVQIPLLKILFGVLGVAFLLFYGARKILEGIRGQATQLEGGDEIPVRRRDVIWLSLGFSLLNPHVYLDTVILIGGYSSKFQELVQRLEFGLGAAFFSTLWFFGLALFSSRLRRFLATPSAMRLVSFLSGLVLLLLSWKLGAEVWSWML